MQSHTTNKPDELVTGQFSILPNEIIFLCLADYLDIFSLVMLARTTKNFSTLSSLLFSWLENPWKLLDSMASMSAQQLLKFKDYYFRPTDSERYQKLRNQGSNDLTHETEFVAFLNYALLTDNINELNISNLEQCLKWISHHENKKYHLFIPCIKGILSIREESYHDFQSICYKKANDIYPAFSSLFLTHDNQCNFNLNNYYLNFAGAEFTRHHLKGNPSYPINEYVIDFRACNLENTLWRYSGVKNGVMITADVKIKNVCFAGANLVNAKFVLAHFISCNFWLSNCQNANFKYLRLHDQQILKETNCEGAKFRNLIKLKHTNPQLVFDTCNLENANFEGSPINILEFKNSNIKNINFLDNYYGTYSDIVHNLDYPCFILSSSHPHKSELRNIIAHNMVRKINSIDINTDLKINLFKYAMNHPFFAHQDVLFRKVEKNVMTFFSTNYEQKLSGSQKIISLQIEELEKELSIKKEKNKQTISP